MKFLCFVCLSKANLWSCLRNDGTDNWAATQVEKQGIDKNCAFIAIWTRYWETDLSNYLNISHDAFWDFSCVFIERLFALYRSILGRGLCSQASVSPSSITTWTVRCTEKAWNLGEALSAVVFWNVRAKAPVSSFCAKERLCLSFFKADTNSKSQILGMDIFSHARAVYFLGAVQSQW